MAEAPRQGRGWRDVWSTGFGRGPFPHQLSWLIDNPLRRLLHPPSRLLDRLALNESDSVLEVGPGSGFLSVELARRVPRGRLVLLDLQLEMLAKARRKLVKAGLENVDFAVHDASLPFPFRSESFDVAIMVAVLGEVSNPEACLHGLHRVLRPGGRLAIEEFEPDPDHIPFRLLQPLVEGCGYRLGRRWGRERHYTATFERMGDRP